MNYIYARYDIHYDELELWISEEEGLLDESNAEELGRCIDLEFSFGKLAATKVKRTALANLLNDYTKEEIIEELNKLTN